MKKIETWELSIKVQGDNIGSLFVMKNNGVTKARA